MIKIVKSKPISVTLIFSFLLFISPHFVKAKTNASGNLIGFVYDMDETTPLEGAIIKLKNVSSGTIYESNKSDKLGIFKIEGIDQGLYICGVSVEEKNFNVANIIGIKAGETAKVSFSLKPITAVKDANYFAAGFLAFFLSPIGIAVIVAATAAIIYGVVKLVEEEKEVSPFKKK